MAAFGTGVGGAAGGGAQDFLDQQEGAGKLGHDVLVIPVLNFELVSDFEFRISDFAFLVPAFLFGNPCSGSACFRSEAAGVFGVPTMALDGELFWGVDALPVLEWRLRAAPPTVKTASTSTEESG